MSLSLYILRDDSKHRSSIFRLMNKVKFKVLTLAMTNILIFGKRMGLLSVD